MSPRPPTPTEPTPNGSRSCRRAAVCSPHVHVLRSRRWPLGLSAVSTAPPHPHCHVPAIVRHRLPGLPCRGGSRVAERRRRAWPLPSHAHDFRGISTFFAGSSQTARLTRHTFICVNDVVGRLAIRGALTAITGGDTLRCRSASCARGGYQLGRDMSTIATATQSSIPRGSIFPRKSACTWLRC